MRSILRLSVYFILTITFAKSYAAPEHKIPATQASSTDKKEQQWSYHGESGPAHWAELDPAFASCSYGRQQSPINIDNAYMQSQGKLQIKYQPTKLSVLNDGHTIQLPVEPGNFIEIGQDRYQLLQLNFHSPSEEAISGKHFAMDIHLVHRNDAGQLAVLTVLIGQGLKDHPLFNILWQSLPEANESRTFDMKTFNPADILPTNLDYWTYIGSLTTPPCTEGVRWMVLKNPIQLSKRQIARFQHFYSMNARPIQPLNSRAILDAQ
ncbi:MAG: carbonic anhydrase family protein [Formivibrio sp.]|nr:carbonic anhydrase family protein [Formivibrio sp.]